MQKPQPVEYKFNVCSAFISPLLPDTLFEALFSFLSISLNNSVYIISQFLQWLYNNLVKIYSINTTCHYPLPATTLTVSEDGTPSGCSRYSLSHFSLCYTKSAISSHSLQTAKKPRIHIKIYPGVYVLHKTDACNLVLSLPFLKNSV